jgi:hypothetical protein
MGLNTRQIEQLLRPVNPKRVQRDRAGNSHLAAYDVSAHLTRIFGFGGWEKRIRTLELVSEDGVKDGNRTGWWVTYRCLMTLDIKDPSGAVIWSNDDGATGSSSNLPSRGDAHDFALKNAISYALKRCAKDLGDQFGLSLYNKGSLHALIGTTLSFEGDSAADVEKDIPELHPDTDDAVAPDTAPVPPPATRPTRPAANGKARAVPPADAVTDLDWMTHLVSDLIPAATTAPELEQLWNQVGEHVRAATCTRDDEKDIGSLLTGRAGELGLNIPVAGKTPAQRLADQAARAADMPSLKAVADEARQGGLSRESVTAPNGKTGSLADYIGFCRKQLEGQKASAAA